MVLKRLDPLRYPTIDGINSLETIFGQLGNTPSQELDIGGGGFVIDGLP
jgi:hypothetical protein